MKQDFDIEVHDLGPSVTVLRLRGRLDARGATVLTARCAEARGAGRHLVLNFREVTFIASSGIGALLALVEESRHTRIRVRLAVVPPAVDSVIRLLNLDQFLSIVASEADARAELEAA